MHLLIILILVILVGFLSYKLKNKEKFGSINIKNIAQTLGSSNIATGETLLAQMSKSLVN